MRGLRLGRLFGIEVIVDASWLIIALLVTWAVFLRLDAEFPRSGRAALWALAAAGAALFFASVLVHELSHSVVALARGMRVRRIRLFLFGGVSEMDAEAGGPNDELLVTVAGPASSLGLGGLLAAAAVALPSGSGLRFVVAFVAGANILLGIFNLLPGFPLDGGRVLRAVVWRATGSRSRATRTAVWGGRIVAAGLIVVGAIPLLAGRDLGGLWFVAIGWFLLQAANRQLDHQRLEDRLAAVTVAEVMAPVPRPAWAEQTLQEFYDREAIVTNFGAYPVVEAGRAVGIVGIEELRRTPRERWAEVGVGEVMRRVPPERVVSPATPVLEVLSRLGEGEELLVADDGRALGVVTPRDVSGWLDRAS